MGVTRDDVLFAEIMALLEAAATTAADLEAVVCGAGPGSFTSLRIGASLAKGLAFAVRRPLYAASSLVLAAAQCRESGEYVVHADALRGERYAMRVQIDEHGLTHSLSDVVRVSFPAIPAFAHGAKRLAVGSSPDPALEHATVTPDAGLLHRGDAWLAGGPVDLDSWEPAYGRLAEAQVKWEETHGRALADE